MKAETVTIHDTTHCLLGEGPLWHPERGELFWFDILGRKLHRKDQNWTFDMFVSAAGWMNRDTLIVASQVGLHRFDITSGAHELLCPLEADNPETRSNDGRADPQGGFWIGTMAIDGGPKGGAIYRYFKGELRKLYADISISNAICFAPDGRTAYFADTPTKLIMRQKLDPVTGWPDGRPQVHIDLNDAGLAPDGAVVDAEGRLWNAQWGAARVACYLPDGSFSHAVDMPASQTTCPAFGGPDLRTLFCTSATVDLSQAHLAAHPASGQTFAVPVTATGQKEHRVIL